MVNNTASLDFYNSHFYIKFEDKEFYWHDSSKFIADTGYPYSNTTGLLSYEPIRNIYNVERIGSQMVMGENLEEIKWLIDNKERLIPVLNQLIQAAIPVITLEMTRAYLLADSDWIVQRHQEQLSLNIATTLTNEQYIALLNYKQELRNLTPTYSKNTPSEQVTWPVNPLN
jgi:hypothetical protein